MDIKNFIKNFNGKPVTLKRILFMVIGIFINNFNVGLLRASGFGVDPFQSMNVGIGNISPLSFGTTELIICLILLAISFLLDRSLLFIGTIIIVLSAGYTVNAGTVFFGSFIVNPSMPVRILCLAIGTLVTSFMASMYYVADMGVSSYDAISLGLSRRIKRIPYRIWRIITDVLCVTIGAVSNLAAGCSVKDLLDFIGIGTVIFAGFTGPLLDLFIRKVVTPLYYGKRKTN